MTTKDITKKCRTAAKQTILFVGDPLSFSEVYLRFIENELGDVKVEVVSTLADAKSRAKPNLQHVGTLICSGKVAYDERDILTDIVGNFGHIHPVIAFDNMREVQSLLGALDDDLVLKRLSFLQLRTKIDCLIGILQLLASGERHVSGDVLDWLIDQKDSASDAHTAGLGATMDVLTVRENEVLKLLAVGNANKVIAHSLALSESTIKLHIHRIIKKLGVKNRTEAAIAFLATDGSGQLQHVK